jgi:hypothetical protein
MVAQRNSKLISSKKRMLYYGGDQTEKNETGWKCNTFQGEEKCAKGFGGKPEGMRQIGRPRHRLKDNIKIDLKEVEWGT